MDVYVIKLNGKRIFATSLIVEFHTKQMELVKEGKHIDSEFLFLTKLEHRELLRECTHNIINGHRKGDSMKMTDK